MRKRIARKKENDFGFISMLILILIFLLIEFLTVIIHNMLVGKTHVASGKKFNPFLFRSSRHLSIFQ